MTTKQTLVTALFFHFPIYASRRCTCGWSPTRSFSLLGEEFAEHVADNLLAALSLPGDDQE